MKTAVSIIQEFMIKIGEQVRFDVVYQGGPPHQMIFKYQCTAAGISVTASGRSKKEAKQESAALCLSELEKAGIYKPPPTTPSVFTRPAAKRQLTPPPEDDNSLIKSYVALIREFCEEYHLPAPEYVLIRDAGPAHCREFEFTVTVGAHTRNGVCKTKKSARQIAARKLYLYLRENLNKVTRDFDEDAALVKATLRAQEKFMELKREAQPWRPNLGMRCIDAHHSLKNSLGGHRRARPTFRDISWVPSSWRVVNRAAYDEQQLADVKRVMNDMEMEDVIDKAETVLRILDLEFEWVKVPTQIETDSMLILNVPRACPAFTVASPPVGDPDLAKWNTAKEVLRYVDIMLQ